LLDNTLIIFRENPTERYFSLFRNLLQQADKHFKQTKIFFYLPSALKMFNGSTAKSIRKKEKTLVAGELYVGLFVNICMGYQMSEGNGEIIKPSQ